MSESLVRVNSLSKTYVTDFSQDVNAVREVSFEICEGELVALMGSSGSGKSTLLNLVGGLDRPTNGSVEVNGQLLNDMQDKELDKFRLTTIGFVFQQFYLMPNFSVAENVALTALIRNQPRSSWMDRVIDLLDEVDLLEKIDSMPNLLSGGQQQRVAVCRALFGDPKVLLADEPTGNLDSENSVGVLSLIRRAINSDSVAAGILVTHDAEAATIADRVLLLKDGSILGEYRPASDEASGTGDKDGGDSHAKRIRAWIKESSC